MEKRYIVSLTDEERSTLRGYLTGQRTNSMQRKRAHILLGADASAKGKKLTDKHLSEKHDMNVRNIQRLRQRFVEQGFEDAFRGASKGLDVPKKIDGQVEAHLVALCSTEAPEGYGRWTLRLLADQMVSLGYIDSISHESIRKTLKKRIEAMA